MIGDSLPNCIKDYHPITELTTASSVCEALQLNCELTKHLGILLAFHLLLILHHLPLPPWLLLMSATLVGGVLLH